MSLPTPHKNVYIIGPQSTGKTTLVNALETLLLSADRSQQDGLQLPPPAFVREVARDVLRAHQFSRDDIFVGSIRGLELQRRILDAQLAAEDVALSAGSRSVWLISDRSGVDPIVYARVFNGPGAAAELTSSEAWSKLRERMRHGLVFLCGVEPAWLVDDGTRRMPDNEDDWMQVESAFREVLTAQAIDFIDIPRGVHEIGLRIGLIIDAIDRWGGRSSDGLLELPPGN